MTQENWTPNADADAKALAPHLTIDKAVLGDLRNKRLNLQQAFSEGQISVNEEGAPVLRRVLSLGAEISQEVFRLIAREKTNELLENTERTRETVRTQEDASKEVQQQIFTLTPSAAAELIIRPSTPEGAAADALLALAVVDPEKVETILKQLPRDTFEGLTAGLATCDRTGILEIAPAIRIAELIEDQLENDKKANDDISDKNSMNAALLLKLVFEERADWVEVLARLSEETINEIIKFDYTNHMDILEEEEEEEENDNVLELTRAADEDTEADSVQMRESREPIVPSPVRSGDPYAAEEAQQELKVLLNIETRELIEDRRRELEQEAQQAAEVQAQVVAKVAPKAVVKIDQEIDLDDI